MAVQRDKVIANAEKLVAKGKIEPAIKEYERLLDDNPNDVNTLNRIGDLWVRINRNDEAVKVFTKIADHYGRDGFFLKAIAIYKKINKLDPSKLDIYAKLADLYAKQGLAMEAKSQYQVLADYYLKHGDPANGLTIYKKISELDPNSINVHVKLADLYSQNSRTADALKEYDRVGRMLLKRGMLDEAVQVFKKALKIDPSNTELVDSLVTALLEAKDYTNAIGIVETGLESRPDDARLLAMMGRIQIAKGDARAAKAALERGLASNANDPGLREAAADLYIRLNQPDQALEMITPLVEKAMSRGERGTAVEMLNRVLRVDSGHTPTLERLVAVYVRLNEETNILASMNSLAEAHIARGSFDQAATVLDKLIQREPQNAQHRNKLQFVRSQMGGIDTIPAAKKEAPAPAPAPRAKTAHDTPMPAPLSMEIDEALPTIDSLDDEPALSLGLDDSEPIELNTGFDTGFDIGAPSFESPAAPPPRIEPEMEMPGLEIEEEVDEDLDFITEHLTEAEVFAKYGLAEKAAEHLRTIIERAPKHQPAHEKLIKILLDEGDMDAARNAANAYIKVLQENGDDDAVSVITGEFISRGQSLTGPPAAKPAPPPPPAPPPVAAKPPASPKMPTFERPMPAAPPPPVVEEEFSIDLEEPADSNFDIGLPAPTEEEEPVLAFEETPIESSFDNSLGFGDLDEAPAAVEEQPFFGVEAEAPSAPAFADDPSAEEIREVDFYIEQELFDEAREKVDALVARFPGNRDVQKRSDRLSAAAAAAAAIAAITPPPPAKRAPAPAPPPKIDIDSELLTMLPDDDEDFAPPPPPAAPPPPLIPMPAIPEVEENLFADEDDFFDLASELESELADEEEPIALAEEEQSLEEIFKEFKKGVEQQLDSEDYDTHYNLGIAYKEMGLIDEAIGEFQLASKDPKRAVECASMLGLCFIEKGMPQLAIKWYRKGLEMPEISEDEHLGLLYDLASAYMEVGDTDNAQRSFMEVYGLNTNYRDVVSRMKQLEDARK